MQVKLYASLRVSAGVKMIEIEYHTGITIQDVLIELTQAYPVLDKFIWAEPAKLSDLAHVFINGENIRHLAGLGTPLTPEDHVDIFPPLVGG